jgi:diaminopimelate decarboxylase
MNASFGIWHEYGREAMELARSRGVSIDRMHIHVGSGADVGVWGGVMDEALVIARQFEDVTSLDIGGGYAVERYDGEQETDIESVCGLFAEKLTSFHHETGRALSLEIEPGSYAIAHAGTLVATVDEIVDTGAGGRVFIRLNTGMNDFLRSAMYGARHRIEVVSDSMGTGEYLVVGHNCESGDIFTTLGGDPEGIEPRTLRKAVIGDEVRIHDVGAYCAGMRARGYNSFPDAPEVMVD